MSHLGRRLDDPQASDEKDSIPSQIGSARELVQRNDGRQEVHEPLIITGHSLYCSFLAAVDAAWTRNLYPIDPH
jgi:hypothetical protein